MDTSEFDADESPPTLVDLCLHYCVNNLTTFCEVVPSTGRFILKEGVSLPPEICENILQTYTAEGTVLGDNFMHIFKDHLNTHLRRINVQDSNLSEVALLWLLPHKPVELNISGLEKVSKQTLLSINQYGKNLIRLFIGDSIGIFQNVEIKAGSEERHSSAAGGDGGSRVFGGDYLFDCPEIRAFSVHNLNKMTCPAHDIISTALHPFTKLSYLDLSMCHVDIEFMDCLEALQNLHSLILYNVPITNIKEAFQVIAKLKSLRSLDLSQARETNSEPVMYANPEKNLADLVSNLPDLVNLDLSGTNLAGYLLGLHEMEMEDTNHQEGCSIPGLEGRQLDFLGLLNCAYDACRRKNIPANKITGEDSEMQIVFACQTYQEKRTLLLQSMEHLCSYCKHTSFSSAEALTAVLNAMRRFSRDKSIQLCGSAACCFMLRNEERNHGSTGVHKQIRKILKTLMDAMENHMTHWGVLRNCIFCIGGLKMPEDIIKDFNRLVGVLLSVMGRLADEHTLTTAQERCIELLNHLACQVDGDEKERAGDLGAIDVMLHIITRRLEHPSDHADDIMEYAWSTMWNFTDETAKNCQRFFDGDGLGLFLRCLKDNPNRQALVRNMMGLMGNVAEVKYLRPRLLKTPYITVFCDLLNSPHDDGIEVSYNACGVLAHILSDGAEAWTINEPRRDVVQVKMTRAINRWSLEEKRNINYRSFKPILRLLPARHSPESQHWAVWALCNLTGISPEKYCETLQEEEGLKILQELIAADAFSESVKMLAEKLLGQCRRYLNDSPDPE